MDLFNLSAKISLDSSEYESGVSNAANSSGTLEDSLENIGDAASGAQDDMSGVGDAADGAADGLDGAADAGDGAADGLDGAADAADGAGDSFSSMGDSADGAGDSLSGMGESASGVSESLSAADVMAGNLASSGLTSLASALGDLITDTVSYGDNIDKMSQKIGISSQAYQEWAYVCDLSGASVDGLKTGMKTLSTVITDAGNNSSTASDKLSAVGLTFDDLKDKTPEEQLETVVKALQNMEPGAERTAAATDLLGRSGTDLAAVFNMTNEELDGLLAEADEYAVISDENVEASAELKDQMTRVKDIFKTTGANLAAELMPALSGLCDLILTVAKPVLQWLSDHMDIIAPIVTGLAVGLGVLAGAIAVSSAATAIWNAVLGLNPITIIIVAVAALAAGLIALWNTNDGFREAVISAWEKIKSVAETVWNAVAGFFTETIPNAITTVLEFFSSLPTKILEFITSAKDHIVQWATDIATKAKEAASNFLTNIVEFFTQLPGKISNFISSALNKIKEWATNIATKAKEAASNFLSNIVSFFTQLPGKIYEFITSAALKIAEWEIEIIQKAKSAASGFLSSIVEFFTQLPGKIYEFVTNAALKIAEWEIEIIQKAKSAASGFLNNIVEFFTQLPGKVYEFLTSALSRVTSWAGELASNASTAASNFISNIVNKLSELPGNVYSKLAEVLSSVGSWGSEMISKFKSIGVDIIQGLINGITSMVSNLYSSIKNALSGLVDKAKKAVGVASPSKVFRDEIGKMIGAGLALGIEDSTGEVEDAMDEMMSATNVAAEMQNALDTASSDLALSASTGGEEGAASLIDELLYWCEGGGLKELLTDVLVNNVSFSFEGREVGRLVRKYA